MPTRRSHPIRDSRGAQHVSTHSPHPLLGEKLEVLERVDE